MKLKIELIAAKVPVDFHNGVKILLAYDDDSVVRHMELPVIDWLVGYSVESMSSIETRAVINSMSFLQHGIRCYSYCFLDEWTPQNGSDVSNVSKTSCEANSWVAGDIRCHDWHVAWLWFFSWSQFSQQILSSLHLRGVHYEKGSQLFNFSICFNWYHASIAASVSTKTTINQIIHGFSSLLWLLALIFW